VNHTSTVELSVIIPCYNESEVLVSSVNLIAEVVQALTDSFEIILVDDGSLDETPQLCLNLVRDNQKIRCLRLKRNFGHMAAISAGYKEALGNAVVTIDADLQDPPIIIKEMFEIWRNSNCDYVQAVRNDRSTDTYFKKITAWAYYSLMRKMTEVRIENHSGDFRLISREILEELNKLQERNKVYRLLIPWMGYEPTFVYYKRESRKLGVTKYTYKKMFNLAVDSLLSFSSKPLRIMSQLSLAATVILMICAAAFFILHFYVNAIPGWTSIVFLTLSINSALLGGISIIGEYIGKIYEISLNRPMYTYKEVDK